MKITPTDSFEKRHVGISQEDEKQMLATLNIPNLDKLIDETIPPQIRLINELDIPDAMSEYEYLEQLKKIAAKNKLNKTYIGQGYYGTITPSPLLRNIFQNPGWYTQYTPYQAEISQGRLEALLNFQTMVSDLTGMPLANASLLDEGTAAAEAMGMFYSVKNKRKSDTPINKFFIDNNVFAQTKDVILSRAIPLEIQVVEGDWKTADIDNTYCGALLQYPNAKGCIEDYEQFSSKCKDKEVLLCVAADIMSLALLKPPGEWGADVVVGSTQRFGVPIGFGGPHAAYFATSEKYKRQIPGRIIGVSVDRLEKRALRMALQTREQHIKREKATSNICTAQALLAVMASMYAVYHGPAGIKRIATRINELAFRLGNGLKEKGYKIHSIEFFDTITLNLSNSEIDQVKKVAEENDINLFYQQDHISVSIDETISEADIEKLIGMFPRKGESLLNGHHDSIPNNLKRQGEILTHPVFSSYNTETEIMRYTKSLENKDLSLMHSMIPLGSCTMKLNAAAELIPVSWPEFANIHPFVPEDQALGYKEIIDQLEAYLCEITGFTACSLMPNSGAQGELAGLLVIRAYHENRGQNNRNIAIIPSSAHGTNPASAIMAGMKVIVVSCDDNGNINIDDLKAKAIEHKENLAALMVTYPSTHGVFEEDIMEICQTIHENGGLVYMDGANMNAQVGLTSPNAIGADVCHLNLHKTFAIPHGGGGPGMGPICVNDKLKPYLPDHIYNNEESATGINAVSAAPWGSASILLISYGYIRMLGKEGVTNATKYAILNANYIKERLTNDYSVLYLGKHGRTAHELILDLRMFKSIGITAEDVAKRLIDYGFHAPTLSFPVPGTIMIEPTESESKSELDRFCDAMIEIKKEIDEVARGDVDATSNVLKNAPHPLSLLTADDWEYKYTRSKAAYPIDYLRSKGKFWATVSRVDNAYGDRNLICTCPPMESYMEELS